MSLDVWRNDKLVIIQDDYMKYLIKYVLIKYWLVRIYKALYCYKESMSLKGSIECIDTIF